MIMEHPYAHYTAMRVETGRLVRGLGLHVRRLGRDCEAVFGASLDPERVRSELRRGLDGVPLPVIARVTLADPELPALRVGDQARPGVFVSTRHAVSLPAPPLRVRMAAFSRELPHIKHTGLMPALYQRRQAQLAGYDDALLVNAAGEVTEGVTWNVGFVADGEVIWPAAEALAGVTATLLARVCDAARTVPVPAAALGNMDAAFATSVTVGVRPIAAIDGHAYDVEHPLLAELSARYLAIEGEPI
jgi:branched-subunit amino acid aminotransferase/4-amino-4-deoxychorismate lyase